MFIIPYKAPKRKTERDQHSQIPVRIIIGVFPESAGLFMLREKTELNPYFQYECSNQ